MARRLLFSYLLLVMVTIALLAFIAYRVTEQSFDRYRTAHTLAHTELLPPMLAYYYTTNGSWDGVQMDVSRISLMVGTKVSVVDRGGRVVAATQRNLVGETIADDFPADQVLTIVTGRDQPIGTVYVQFNPAFKAVDQNFRTNLLWGFLLAGGVVASMTILLGIFLARSMTRPLTEMSVAASEIARGNYTTRVTNLGRDEVALLGNAFNQMAEGLGSLEHLRRELVANVSHDLRGPLTVIHGYLEGLRSGQIADRRTAETAFEAMSDEVGHLQTMVDDLRHVAMLDAGALVLQRTQCNVAEIVHAAIKRVTPLAAERNIHLTRALANDLPPLYIDAKQIGQALFNLLENAIRHTPQAGLVTITAARDDEASKTIHLTVNDNGTGIPSDQLPHVFERFYRGDSARNRTQGGAGLGLAIVKSIVEAHGGEVIAESSGVSGEGSRFIICLPILPTAEIL